MIAKILALSLSRAVVTHGFVVADPLQCNGKETGFAPCNLGDCPDVSCKPTNCELADWGDWSSCDCTGLSERERSVAVHNNECGMPCYGALIDTKRCKTPCRKDPEDCVFSAWTPWGACSEKKLSLTQECRSRVIVSIEKNGGAPCVGELEEIQPLPPKDPIDCEYGDWAEWETCSKECGSQTTRSRAVIKPALHGGEPCTLSLNETKACEDTICPPDIDCVWNDWTTWSGCTCTCDGGQRTRDRRIKVAPRGQGALCNTSDRTQIEGCNTQPCIEDETCVNGAFGDWGPWGKCTATCGGGVKWRSRAITVEANACGVPAVGNDKEYMPCGAASCSEKVDCELGEWSSWSDCSCECNGVKRRGRVIEVYGKGIGKWCDGSLKDIMPCNVNATVCPDHSVPTPAPVDCEMGPWETKECSVSCGKGTAVKGRVTIQEGAYGGKLCSGPLSKAIPCIMDPCPTPAPPPPGTDCLWGDWSDWGECDKCGGQRKRNRHIDQMPEDGGKACLPKGSEEVGKCDRHCHDVYYCNWGDWSEIGSCSKTCGDGRVQVERNLKASSSPVGGLTSLSDLQGSIAASNRERAPELFLSFACGSLISFVAIGIALRATRRSDATNSVRTDSVSDEQRVPIVSVE